jgi:hypothetical protein
MAMCCFWNDVGYSLADSDLYHIFMHTIITIIFAIKKHDVDRGLPKEHRNY